MDTDWQPIETAPKSGMFLVYYPPQKITRDNHEFEIKDGEMSITCSLAMNLFKDMEDHKEWVATHWMPLPKPPEEV